MGNNPLGVGVPVMLGCLALTVVLVSLVGVVLGVIVGLGLTAWFVNRQPGQVSDRRRAEASRRAEELWYEPVVRSPWAEQSETPSSSAAVARGRAPVQTSLPSEGQDGDHADTPTLKAVLAGLPPSIAQDFSCTQGPHRLREAGGMAFCLVCNHRRRLDQPAPSTPPPSAPPERASRQVSIYDVSTWNL